MALQLKGVARRGSAIECCLALLRTNNEQVSDFLSYNKFSKIANRSKIVNISITK